MSGMAMMQNTLTIDRAFHFFLIRDIRQAHICLFGRVLNPARSYINKFCEQLIEKGGSIKMNPPFVHK